MYKRNKIGEKGDPWGTPASIGKESVCRPSIALLSVSQAFTQQGGLRECLYVAPPTNLIQRLGGLGESVYPLTKS